MAFHKNSDLDAAFDSTSGFADDCTISEPERAEYSATAIFAKGVEVTSSGSGLVDRVDTLEFRKADLQDPDGGLLKRSEVILGDRRFRIAELLDETTYTMIYSIL